MLEFTCISSETLQLLRNKNIEEIMNPIQESDQSFSHARMLTSNRTTMPIMFVVENESSWYINDDREFRRVCEGKNEAEYTEETQEERKRLVGVTQDGKPC